MKRLLLILIITCFLDIIPAKCDDNMSIWLENDCLKNMSKCNVYYNIIEDSSKIVVHLFDSIEKGDTWFLSFKLVRIGNNPELVKEEKKNLTSITHAEFYDIGYQWEAEFPADEPAEYRVGVIRRDKNEVITGSYIITVMNPPPIQAKCIIEKQQLLPVVMPFEIFSFKIINTGNTTFFTSIPFSIERYEFGQWIPYDGFGGGLVEIPVHPEEEYQQQSYMMSGPTIWPSICRINKNVFDENGLCYISGAYFFFPGYIWFILAIILLPFFIHHRKKKGNTNSN